MDLSLARDVLNHLRRMTLDLAIPDSSLRLGPVGLGEPLLHPHFIDIVRYGRTLFPGAFIHGNTNCLTLSGEKAEGLIDSGLDSLILSLCYTTRELYARHTGTDGFAEVDRNIEAFLRLKGSRRPDVTIHVFDLPENGEGFSSFMNRWGPLLNRNDFAGLYGFLPLDDWTPKEGERYPCSQPYSVLMVDVEGYVFPCCISVWIPRAEDLCLGHITDPPAIILDKADTIRRRHLAGDFGICGGCAHLAHESGQYGRFLKKLGKQAERLKPGQGAREN